MHYLSMPLSDARVEVVVITVFNYAVAQRAVAQCAVAQRASQQAKDNATPDKSQTQDKLSKPTEVDQAMCKSNATNTSKFSRRSKHTRKNKGNY